MAQTPLTENWHSGGFLVSQANGHRSKDRGLITGGVKLLAGTVLAGEETGGAAVATAGGSNTGAGVMGSITVSAQAKLGTYTLKITKAATNAGDFEVIDPNGDVAGLGTVAVAYNTGGLAFTLADGSPDFAVGDTFSIVVTAVPKFAPLDFTSTSGLQNAVGILYADADASAADVHQAVVVRTAEVNASELVWPAGATNTQIAAATVQLTKLGIISR